MAGRGQNNKAGSAGRGAGNQSNQGFGQSAQRGKSDHDKHKTGGERSMEENKEQDQSSYRDHSTKKRAS